MSINKSVKFSVGVVIFPIMAMAASPEELLQSSDRARGAAASVEGIAWTANVENFENGKKTDSVFEIKVRGYDALAQALEPVRQRGETILFNDRVLWFVKPGLKKPISISPRQRLVGQTANGDIASTRYARDYEAVLIGEEQLNGKAVWKLELKAKAKNVTYDQIRYWISKAEKLGVKAEFLTVSGEKFKTAEFKYENTIELAGKKYPFVSEMAIADANNPENKSIIHYKSPKVTSLPVSMFNVNNLAR